MNKTIFLTGIIFGVLAVVFGAFATHGLENVLNTKALQTFETGVKYQMYHALFLLVLSNVTKLPEESKKGLFYVIVTGILFFSFSIYGLATNTLTTFDFKSIAFITPIGGSLLIIGWIMLGYRYYKQLN